MPTNLGIKEYFIFSFPGILFLATTLASGYYYIKKQGATTPIKFFLGYLWIVLCIEFIASYSVIGYFSNYNYFAFIENSPFRRNTWVYNFYDIINPMGISLFFLYYSKNNFFKNAVKILLVLFLLLSLYFQFIKTSFFENSPFVVLVGTFLILGVVLQFFYELLSSNLILKLKTYLPLYIAIGVFVFNLVTAPLSIFSDYFNITNGNHIFVKLQVYVVLISNVFMYSCFIIGFLLCSRKKKYS